MLSLFWKDRMTREQRSLYTPRDFWFVGRPVFPDDKKIYPLLYRHYTYDYTSGTWDELSMPAGMFENKAVAEAEAERRNLNMSLH